MDGKLVIKGDLKLLSPLHIGSGERDFTDLDVIRDNEGKPFITFTSFIGALRHFLEENFDLPDNSLKIIFGYSDEINLNADNGETDSRGSSICGTDFYLIDNMGNDFQKSVVTRDGIKINQQKGIVEPKAKYDYQIVERNTKFNFKIEAPYSVSTASGENSRFVDKTVLLQYFATIMDLLRENDLEGEQSGLRIGAKTSNGLGRIALENGKLMDYDFSYTENIICWLKHIDTPNCYTEDPIPFKRIEEDFIIDAYLDLKTSLIQRAYNFESDLPDSTHIKSGDADVLTGSGIKGAIVARAMRITNTLWDENLAEHKAEFINNLFGFVDTENKNLEPIKSRLQIEERELPAYIAEIQSRIKIDRFTGGTITGALFDSMPLYNTRGSSGLNDETDLKNYTRLTIRVFNCSKAEVGLILLVLKDLWTGDLAIGGEKGVGRGVFNGVFAYIKYKSEAPVKLTRGLENLNQLQLYVDELISKAGGKNDK